MSLPRELWIDAALGEAPPPPLEQGERGQYICYERTAARAHLALALDAPLTPPDDLRARLVRQGLLAVARRARQEGDE